MQHRTRQRKLEMKRLHKQKELTDFTDELHTTGVLFPTPSREASQAGGSRSQKKHPPDTLCSRAAHMAEAGPKPAPVAPADAAGEAQRLRDLGFDGLREKMQLSIAASQSHVKKAERIWEREGAGSWVPPRLKESVLQREEGVYSKGSHVATDSNSFLSNMYHILNVLCLDYEVPDTAEEAVAARQQVRALPPPEEFRECRYDPATGECEHVHSLTAAHSMVVCLYGLIPEERRQALHRVSEYVPVPAPAGKGAATRARRRKRAKTWVDDVARAAERSSDLCRLARSQEVLLMATCDVDAGGGGGGGVAGIAPQGAAAALAAEVEATSSTSAPSVTGAGDDPTAAAASPAVAAAAAAAAAAAPVAAPSEMGIVHVASRAGSVELPPPKQYNDSSTSLGAQLDAAKMELGRERQRCDGLRGTLATTEMRLQYVGECVANFVVSAQRLFSMWDRPDADTATEPLPHPPLPQALQQLGERWGSPAVPLSLPSRLCVVLDTLWGNLLAMRGQPVRGARELKPLPPEMLRTAASMTANASEGAPAHEARALPLKFASVTRQVPLVPVKEKARRRTNGDGGGGGEGGGKLQARAKPASRLPSLSTPQPLAAAEQGERFAAPRGSLPSIAAA